MIYANLVIVLKALGMISFDHTYIVQDTYFLIAFFVPEIEEKDTQQDLQMKQVEASAQQMLTDLQGNSGGLHVA